MMIGTRTDIAFGYFTTALVAAAALALAAGLQFLLIGLRQKADRTASTFALLCFCLAALAGGRVMIYTASSLAQAALGLHVVVGAALIALPALVLFVGSYTARPVWRPGLAAVVLLAAALSVVNLVEPGTLLNHALYAPPRLRLPWGETLFTIDGGDNALGSLFYLFSYAVFLWAIYRGARQWASGERLRGGMLLACLLVQFSALLWSTVAINAFGMRYPAADAFAFLSFVLLMGLWLVDRLHVHAAQLEQASARLREEATIRQRAEDDLCHAAWHDALTGLPNRLHAQRQLASLLRTAARAGRHGAVLLLDLDNFKTINDALGHHVGDRVLAAIADHLLATVPAHASVARLGGDEFAVLLEADQADAAAAAAAAGQLARHLLDHLAPPLELDSLVLGVGASIGIATYPEAGADAADLLRRADIALYRAKAAGRHAARHFEPWMQRDADERLRLERGLRHALERGELALHYQPQTGPDGRLTGAEALLRWRHPALGMVAPDRFIPIAEETGLIHTLGDWAVATACRQLRAWREQGVAGELRLSVNVSPWQLVNPRFADEVAAHVREAGIEPAALTLELTESALLSDVETARRSLRQLAALGFRLSLDDFGTGYSSLSYLQQLPLHEMKIDRAFVHELHPDAANPLAGFIVDIGRRLRLETVAEGVETQAQRDALVDLGCTRLQGHLIGPALDAASFRQRWLAAPLPARAVGAPDRPAPAHRHRAHQAATHTTG